MREIDLLFLGLVTDNILLLAYCGWIKNLNTIFIRVNFFIIEISADF